MALLVLMMSTSAGAQPNALRTFQSLTYEYGCAREACDGPLFVCLPGFTQHSRSPEYFILTSFLRERGFDYLVVNPRQHGEVFTWHPVFSWGEGEVEEVKALLDSLGVWERHRAVHVLGFSVGGKAALRLGSNPDLGARLTSVIAVAAPWRVRDINVWLSGTITRPLEGIVSGLGAYDRVGLFRLIYMSFFGMSRALLTDADAPANLIRKVRAPTLLLHGRDDWLTRSYHSKRLYRRAGPQQPLAFTVLRTYTHAEDMLSRHDVPVRMALLETLHAWTQYVEAGAPPASKHAFNVAFGERLRKHVAVAPVLARAEEITLQVTPVQYDLNTRLWNSSPAFNAPAVTVNSAISLSGEAMPRLFVSAGGLFSGAAFLNRLRVGWALEEARFEGSPATQFYLSLYQPFGSVLWFRRLSWVQSLTPSPEISLVAADVALMTLDVQVRYGRFVDVTYMDGGADWQLDFNLPLIGDASGSYVLGVGYSRFLTEAPVPLDGSTMKAYFFFGPSGPVAGVRVRGSIQVEQDRLNPHRAQQRWLAGLLMTLGE